MATILLVEDNESFRTLLRRALARHGYTVEEAKNGREGVDAFHRMKIDLVITDLVMPEVQGVETISRIRGLSEDVPIIAVSGSEEISLEAAMLMGANMRLAKPFSIDDLLAAVRLLLDEVEEGEENGNV